MKQSLKVLIDSVGSKSNKVDYVKSMISFLSQHSNLSKSVLWTPATTHVASLYSAADIYVINSRVKYSLNYLLRGRICFGHNIGNCISSCMKTLL
jgi:hypothetical protein